MFRIYRIREFETVVFVGVEKIIQCPGKPWRWVRAKPKALFARAVRQALAHITDVTKNGWAL